MALQMAPVVRNTLRVLHELCIVRCLCQVWELPRPLHRGGTLHLLDILLGQHHRAGGRRLRLDRRRSSSTSPERPCSTRPDPCCTRAVYCMYSGRVMQTLPVQCLSWHAMSCGKQKSECRRTKSELSETKRSVQ
jgi:hypothetical protein